MKPASYMIDHKLGKCPNFPSWQQTSARLFSNTGRLHLGMLTHWGRVTHICASKLIIISSDNGLSPDRHQAIICNNAGIMSIGPLGTKPSEISITIHIFSFKKMHLKMSSGKWRPWVNPHYKAWMVSQMSNVLWWRSLYRWDSIFTLRQPLFSQEGSPVLQQFSASCPDCPATGSGCFCIDFWEIALPYRFEQLSVFTVPAM